MPQQVPVKAPRITVIEIKPLDKGSLRAFVSIQIGPYPFIVHDCRLIQQEGQKAWVSPPQTQWTDKQGQVRYKAIVEWPEEWKLSITEAILCEWESRR